MSWPGNNNPMGVGERTFGNTSRSYWSSSSYYDEPNTIRSKDYKEIEEENARQIAFHEARKQRQELEYRQSEIRRQQERELYEQELKKKQAAEAKALEEKENLGKLPITLGVIPGLGFYKVKYPVNTSVSVLRSMENLGNREIAVNGVSVDDSYLLTEKDLRNSEIVIFATSSH